MITPKIDSNEKLNQFYPIILEFCFFGEGCSFYDTPSYKYTEICYFKTIENAQTYMKKYIEQSRFNIKENESKDNMGAKNKMLLFSGIGNNENNLSCYVKFWLININEHYTNIEFNLISYCEKYDMYHYLNEL